MNKITSKSWINVKIKDIFELKYGKGLPKRVRNTNGMYPVYGSNGIVDYHDDYLISNNAIIFGRKGAVGKVHLTNMPSWPIDTTYYIVPSNYINIKYIYYYLNTINFQIYNRATAIPGINRNDVYSIDFHLAPLNEQHRIVDKIESLFSKIDAGVASLSIAKERLASYRQSLLKAAIEGRLTETWREEHRDELESEKVLQEKITFEKNNHYNKKIPKQMNLVDDKYLYILPKGWTWTIVNSLCESQTGPFGTQLHKTDYTCEGIETVEIGDVHPNRNLSDGSAHYISKQKAKELSKFSIKENDILFTRVGTVGRCTLVPTQCEGWIMSTSLIRLRPFSSLINPQFLLYYFQSNIAHKFVKLTTKGTTRAGTNSKIVGNLPIIVPPIKEQNIIVNLIEKNNSIIENNNTVIDTLLSNTITLKQSILKKAFEGRLVPQDPSDEPASVLLERIQKERASKEKKTTRSRSSNHQERLDSYG